MNFQLLCKLNPKDELMAPKLNGIDHIHINVSDRSKSERWYKDVLGFTRVPELEFWAVDGGPLTLTDERGRVHLALFESDKVQNTTIALNVSSTDLAAWIGHLLAHGIEVKPVDHEVSWSLYFRDINGNPFEITTYEYNEFKHEA